MGFKFGLKLEKVGQEGGATLAEVLADVVDRVRTNVVLIIDEVQYAMTSEDGNQLLLALKAARDAINPRPDTPGYFFLIGTGSHRAMVNELTARRSQAFAGATSLPYPVLGNDYVEHLFKRLASEGVDRLPALDVAGRAFAMLGNRPEEMLMALRQLRQHESSMASPDELFPVIASTLRSATADLELMKVSQLGGLAVAVFERIASSPGDARGLFSADAVAGYSNVLGKEVRVEEIQPVVNELLNANLILRRGHGTYGVTDPFVQEIWRERKSLDEQIGAEPGAVDGELR